jgi:hypothetical protein
MRLAVSCAFLALLASSALAGELAGVTLPDEVTVSGRTLRLNGMGLREATVLRVDVYVAGLYLETPSSSAAEILDSEAPRRLVMEFVRAVRRKDLVKGFTEGFEKNAGRDREALLERLGRLNAWMPDVGEGDTLTFTYTSGEGLLVVVKDEAKGIIPGADFARAFLSIWLGPSPPNPGLKEGLLGGSMKPAPAR